MDIRRKWRQEDEEIQSYGGTSMRKEEEEEEKRANLYSALACDDDELA